MYVEIAFPISRDKLVPLTFYNVMTEVTEFEKM